MRPILKRRFPDFEHAAALIGTGSEVLGFDDVTSQDHHWGPRVQLFVRDGGRSAEVEAALGDELPFEFAGFATNFGPPQPEGSRLLEQTTERPIAHRVEVLVLGGFLEHLIGVNPLQRFTSADWLATPTERLLELTTGAVFDDPIGDLTRVRKLLAWYPRGVWLLVMAGHWRRIAQFEHLHGRAGMRGDELGASILGAALARDAMRLGFLQLRRYPPYPKWFGTAYAALDLPERSHLEAARCADDWRRREDALVSAFELLAQRHNDLALTEHVDPTRRQFHDRPIRIIGGDRFVDALSSVVGDSVVDHRAGSIDAVSDNTDVLTRPPLWRTLVGLYDRA